MTSDLLLGHLAPEPGTEALAAGGVSCGAHAPDEGEDEPGLYQLLQTLKLVLKRWPLTLPRNTTQRHHGRASPCTRTDDAQQTTARCRLLTSRGMKGWKKQSSSFRRLQVRLLSMEVMTSLTDFRKNVMESYKRHRRD